MTQIASEEEVELAVKHLMQRDNGYNTLFLQSLAKHWQANRYTPSKEFNTQLDAWVENYAKQEFEPSPLSDQNKRSIKLQRLLDEVCNLPELDLTYQGVNLATAINMKLAVNLASLIKDEEV